jgi:hypothetical protein
MLGLLTFLLNARAAFLSHSELDYGEGIVWWQAAHVTNWAAAYRPIEVPPYIVFHYPPLYHLTSRAFSLLTGDLLSAGRLVSILSLIGLSLILAVICWRCLPPDVPTLPRWLGAASSGLLIFTLPSWRWACLMRVDTLALFLSFSAIGIYLISRNHPNLIYLCFVLFTASVFTKQTMIAAPSACAVLLFLENRRLFARVAIVTGTIGLSVLALLSFLTNGNFLTNTISYNRNGFIVSQLVRYQFEHIGDSGPVIAASMLIPFAYSLNMKWSRAPSRVQILLARNPFDRLLIVITAVSILAVPLTLAVGKQGANYNYFFEVDLLVSLGAGVFLGWLLREGVRSYEPSAFLFALFLIIVLFLHSTRTEASFYDSIYDAIRRPPPDHSSEVVDVLKNTTGPIYSEDMTVVLEAGKEVEAEPAIITTLASSGQWDESPFVREIESRRFSTIVVSTSLSNKDRYSPRVADAVKANYSLRRQLGRFMFYEPR